MNRKRYIEDYQSKPSRNTTCLNLNLFRFNTSIKTNNISLERRDSYLFECDNFRFNYRIGCRVTISQKRYIEYCPLKSSRDTTCLKSGNFRCIKSLATYNISIKRRDLYLSNVIILASITGFVVELQQIKKGTSKIATPINRFSDYNNASRKQDKESGVTLTKS